MIVTGAAFLVDSDADALNEAVSELGCFAAVADVSDSASVQAAVDGDCADRTHRRIGQKRRLVNNARVLRDKVLSKLSDEDTDGPSQGDSVKRSRTTVAVANLRHRTDPEPVDDNRGGGSVENIADFVD